MPKLSVDDWMVEIDNGLKFREIFGREAAWKQLEMDYLNDIDSNTALGSNLVFSMGDTLLSSLNIPDPEINVSAENPMGVDNAPIVESWDNYLIRKLKLKKEALRSTLHAYLYGVGIWKMGYDSMFGFDPFFDTGSARMPSGMTLTQFDKSGNRIEFGTNPGMPWCKAVSPHDIVVPWGTIDLESAPWVAHRVVRLNAHIKKDPKYRHTSRLEPMISMESYVQSYMNTGVAKRKFREHKNGATQQENTRVLYNELWEICDRSDNSIKVISFDYDEFLRNDFDILQAVCGTPYISGSFVIHPRFFWSTPLAHYLGRLQKKEFDIELQAEKQRRINNLKFIAAKGFMQQDRLNKLVSADVGAIEEADQVDIKDKIAAFPQGNNLEFTLMSRENRQDAREAIGLSRNQMGEFEASSRRTAREVATVQMGSAKRESLRGTVVADLYLESMPKMNQLTFTFQQRPAYAVVGREFIPFTGDQIKGDYLYDLSLSSKRNLSRAERKVEALMTAVQFMQLPGANLPAIYDYVESAANDAAFERIIPKFNNKGMQAQGALPTIPGGGPNA